jgi:hypothetical protein
MLRSIGIVISATQPGDGGNKDVWLKPTGSTMEWYESNPTTGQWDLVLTEPNFQFPIGYVVFNTSGNNPGAELGYGTWNRVGEEQLPAVLYAWRRIA